MNNHFAQSSSANFEGPESFLSITRFTFPTKSMPLEGKLPPGRTVTKSKSNIPFKSSLYVLFKTVGAVSFDLL